MNNPHKQKSMQDGYEFLREAFTREQAVLDNQLAAAAASITHAATAGSVGEDYWIGMLEKYLPRRYAVNSGIIIDSTGKTSDQIDLVIYDLQYTPTILAQGSHRYIPAEAVYAVLEAKPCIDKANLEYAANKAASVRKLLRTSIAIQHAGGTYPAKALFPIVSGIVALDTGWTKGLDESFIENLDRINNDPITRIDCGCALRKGAFDTFGKDLSFSSDKHSLVSFIFRLLNKLQSLGTVPAIDWNAYAEAFQEGSPAVEQDVA